MLDRSFIRFKDSFNKAKNIGDSPEATIFDYSFVQLATDEAYLQITNVDGGISFSGDYTATIVDCEDSQLQDITGNVFIEEFTNTQGVNQMSIELINLGTDHYRQPVYIKLKHNISDSVYYSNPINITDYQKNKTTFFEYKSYDDFQGIGYTNAQKYQAIRLRTYFDMSQDESEITDYYQINSENTISARALIKELEKYKINKINNFYYKRLNTLLKHDVIYVDCIRMTNKTNVESDDRLGSSNFIETSFVIDKNFDDTKEYEYQIFEGLQVVQFFPQGVYTLAGVPPDGKILFNTDIVLNTGVITFYDSLGAVLDSFEETDITVTGNRIDITSFTDSINVNDTYYIHISEGLVSSSLGIDYEGVSDSTTWTITIQDADYSSSDYSDDYFIN